MKEKMGVLLSNLILEYAKNKRNIDKEYLDRILAIYFECYHLEDYVKEINEIKLTNTTYAAYYSHVYKKIMFDIEHVSNMYQEGLKSYFADNSREELLGYYLQVTQIILHEFEHVIQEQKKQEKCESLEKLILEIVDWYRNLDKTDELTKEYYTMLVNLKKQNLILSPKERLAQIYSWEKIGEIAQNIGDDMPYLKKIIKYALSSCYLLNYDKTSNPTKTYLERINSEAEYLSIMELMAKTNPSLKTRMALGLEITDEEYKRVLANHQKIKI